MITFEWHYPPLGHFLAKQFKGMTDLELIKDCSIFITSEVIQHFDRNSCSQGFILINHIIVGWRASISSQRNIPSYGRNVPSSGVLLFEEVGERHPGVNIVCRYEPL